jgi:hypothetical protein
MRGKATGEIPTVRMVFEPWRTGQMANVHHCIIKIGVGNVYVLENGSYYFFKFKKEFFIIHMCIQYLGHFSPLPPPPRYPAETILPLSLILLKREYKQ